MIGGYGEPDTNDMWGLIKTEVSKGWFVPSRGEWSAFGGELAIPTDYANVGLSNYYWSSSQGNANYAYIAGFDYGYVGFDSVYSNYSVRLSTTF